MNKKFKLNPFALAMLPTLLLGNASLALSQEQDDDLEIIQVTGFKGSLLKSLNNKRNSDSITDSIFAEDIGKSADQDIGEALQRVTGVSIQRGEGAGGTEGTTVTVRGAGPNLNNITLNGVVLTGNTENQAVDLSAFSSDILSSIEVFKTSSADQDEGSLGASVELKTFRPLDASEDRKVFEIQGRYDDYAEENDYKLSGSFSKKFLDETLGFYVTAYKETQAARRDMFYAEELAVFEAPNAINHETGLPMREMGPDGELTGDPIKGYINDISGYKLFQNNLEREGLTTSLQWLPSDETEIIISATLSDQYRQTNDNTLSVLSYQQPYFDHDIAKLTDPDNPWLVYDPSNQMFVKKLDRMAEGRTVGEYFGVNTENRIYNVEIQHYFTDDFSMKFRYGSSKTTATDDNYAYMSTGNRRHVNPELLEFLPNVQPVGYDCRTGACNVTHGDGIVTYGPDLTTENFTNNADREPGDPYAGFLELDQSPHSQTGGSYLTSTGEMSNEPNLDNVIYTGYNPDDLASMNLTQGYTRDREMYDKQKSLYLDFDWDVEFGPITSFEFGLKSQKRDKVVFSQRYFFNDVPANAPVNIVNEFSVGNVRVEDVTNGVTPHGDTFLKDLGYERNSVTDGWFTVDPDAALLAIFGTREVESLIDLGNSRAISPSDKAAYLKVNFSLLDDDLTGNIGVRYVDSSVESIGFSGVKFQRPNVADRELVKIGQDSSLPECTQEQLFDETGNYRPAGGLDANGVWGPLPDQLCFHAEHDFGRDPTVTQRYYDYLYPTVDKYAGFATFEEKNWLPSLTLNYDLNDDMVLRFAASKTIARPNIDDRRPTDTFNENVWSSASNATLKNPYLKNLQSTNLDLSYEWYFNEGGALTIALFNKDMSNIPETVTVQSHWLDLRGLTTEELSQYTSLDILIEKPEDGELDHDTLEAQGIDCLENRRHKWQEIDQSFSAPCDIINVKQSRNAAGATNRGVEIGYNQNYDFLPGLWSGLGTAFNYTYSDSKIEAEAGGLLGADFAEMPLANVSKHTYNLSTFWEKEGNLIRLAYNYRSDSLANRNFVDGALWNEGGGQLDISATYKLNDNFTLTFNAVNLNNRVNRQYYTNLKNEDFTIEGDALEGEANKSRTIREWASGTIYRIGLRGSF